jgi:hypothetical protein
MEIINKYLQENSINDFTKYSLIDRGNGIEINKWDYEIDKPNFTQDEIKLSIAKTSKINQAKKLRDSNLNKPTPQTVGSYDKMDNLINRTFNISEKDVEKFNTIISRLQDRIDAGEINPTRRWKTSTVRIALTIDDYKSLRNHLEDRDEQEYDQYNLKVELLNNLTTVEEVEAFDINEIIV